MLGVTVVVVALVMSPLGARAADLLIWWDEGHYAQEHEALEEVLAAFGQESGTQAEIAFHPIDQQPHSPRKSV